MGRHVQKVHFKVQVRYKCSGLWLAYIGSCILSLLPGTLNVRRHMVTFSSSYKCIDLCRPGFSVPDQSVYTAGEYCDVTITCAVLAKIIYI